MDKARQHTTSAVLMRTIGAFKALSMRVAEAAPPTIVNEGPRLLVGRAPGADGMIESPAARKEERLILDSVLRTVNARHGDDDHERNNRADATVVDFPGWIGMDCPVSDVHLGRDGLMFVPSASFWAIYGRVRYARVNKARAAQIKLESERQMDGAGMAAMLSAIIPREDLQEGLGVTGGVAMGMGCPKHPRGQPHPPDELFLSIREKEAWRTIMTSIPGDPLGMGSDAVVTRWARVGGHTEDGVIDAPG